MDKLLSFLDTVPGWMRSVGFGVSVICAIAAFILMQTGVEGAAKSKKWLGYICIAVAGICLAASLVASIRGAAE